MDRRQAAFTLVELMIVVTIIGVLAVVAGTAYRKYMDSGRTAEVYMMFGELRSKEEAYKTEFGNYCNTGAGCTTGADEVNDLFPALLGAGAEPKAKPATAAGATVPAGWTTLGVNPGRSTLYCAYVAVAQVPGVAGWGTAGTDGKNIFSNVVPPVAWFYLEAQCDNDGAGAPNATFTTAMNTTTVVARNEHK
jgi:prepilin-type N-terminal cleavage/methylation domain-containing protein